MTDRSGAANTEPLVQILDDDGVLLEGVEAPNLPDADLVALFDTMVLTRAMDDRMMRLQRQGRLGFYMKSLGEEATHLAVYALREDDWVLPSYREQGAWFWRGYKVSTFVDQMHGNERDPIKGRQMPVHHSAAELNMVSISSPVGTQIPQAVGIAMAMQLAKTDRVALTYFGEGTSSSGDFHVAMNLAGVRKAPVIFFCRNNGWAISVPRSKQSAGASFASRAAGYGMPGVRVDGNDLLAIIQVTREAVARARRGDGPTLIEAVTYRIEGHSSSDDPSVYRDAAEPEAWKKRDPLDRFRNYLTQKGLMTPGLEAQMETKHHDAITAAIAACDHTAAPPVEDLFDEVFEQLPWHLVEQRAQLLAYPRVRSPHKH
ncbi:MAG: hypothetical protein AUK47_28135 [Deltaproteobacteria bacterium CG2_30_63_29]|nr:MAG: hypothetical protein AUK47_28135 [Deltaproteobacteria bacterium CG2_30_63_29]PJB43035.1 MAG: 3-methyl-2-oxobutanoate dehydrogenase [Deltaproteobacteria bacterium CG_4_9_14_3_um_filter_63_12]